jgi:biopolymer transport protein ExbB
MEFLSPIINGLQEFLSDGGWVLSWIMLLAFVLWSCILERAAYYFFAHKPMKRNLRNEWASREDQTSWRAHAIRDELISHVKSRTGQTVGMIKTLVAIAPLLGLLGTVVGMIQVFDVMSLQGSANARLMAGGVFKATIPTMAGMVIALSGLLFPPYFDRKSKRETARFADELGAI